MTTCRARWVVPIVGPPIRDGLIGIEGGRIALVGPSNGAPGDIDLGEVAILPGLVNAHTHLELSYLRGLVPCTRAFTTWVRALMARRAAEPAAELVEAAIDEAIVEARRFGTALIGDIANSPATVRRLKAAGMPAVVFRELIGFRPDDPVEAVKAVRREIAERDEGDVRVSVAPHAPYSVAPALFRAIREDLDGRTRRTTTVHVAESEEEVELLASGSGPWREILTSLGVWDPEWQPPACSPVTYLDRLGFLDTGVLTVHCVQVTGADLERIKAVGGTVVCCPRSNQYVGAGEPPVEVFYALGVRVAFGTDSLASVEDLNLFADLAEARRLAPRVAARWLLESATLIGAQALGFGDELGAIEPGRRAELLSVDVPPEVSDVEEYLVSGIEARHVRWVRV
ncbi:MAG: amidohydrolase family protein [Acidimicrobiia bacterium]|nr:amidohydrolase family protein [Acidimicrobiia bacterium]